MLELKNKIYKKKIGAYSLYISSEETNLPKSLILSYYKALLKGLRENFPNKEEIFKKIGRNQANLIKFSFSPNIYKQLKSLKGNPISRVHLELFKEFYAAYDVFQPNVEISILDVDPKGQKAVYRFKNSIFLDDDDLYIYHIYLMTGITQSILERELEEDVICKVENYHISDDRKDSYFDVSIVIGNND
ncbi:MAG: hypothetical protein BAJALOKI3v1_470012 [Promethearchaeota archaeon]|jgi:hypothetical protein|nr:MAG: hypothetical protein BAJALOKI3v1_470012 [Candidatus Lokiarchaeota archaeon]